MPFPYPTLRVQFNSWQRLASHVFRRSTSSHDVAVGDVPPDASNDPFYTPGPQDYSRSLFTDKCNLTIQAGAGGNGCVSFLRDKHIADGPPNGGDGGTGGNIYIQAVDGETSLHKIARRRIVRAGRGKNGRGSSRGGQRGEDVLLEVPVGTIVRELARHDPVQVEVDGEGPTTGNGSPDGTMTWSSRGSKWILSPSAMPSSFTYTAFPALPRARRSNLAVLQPPAPILLDLSKPSTEPQLLAAGAVGGFGNPHFATKTVTRPPFATKGDSGLRLQLELELKLLADVALVGAPNAGKSTLLRALSRARARVGHWAFTTLAPNVGTVVLDDLHGRARFESPAQTESENGERRTRFTVADVPGLVPDAHLDKGLGLEFLRHVERARILVFVVDLADATEGPVTALHWLWRELDAFERLQEQRLNERTEQRIVGWETFGSGDAEAGDGEDGLVAVDEEDEEARWNPTGAGRQKRELMRAPVSAKPWFVVATKADLEGTRGRFEELQAYLDAVSKKGAPHPSSTENGWQGTVRAIPVSAIKGEGADGVVRHAADLLSRF